MNKFVTFRDEKCVVDGCNNICAWGSSCTMCDTCYNKHYDNYCITCQKILRDGDTIDLNDIDGKLKQMRCQYMSNWVCKYCRTNKVTDTRYLIKGFGYKDKFMDDLTVAMKKI